MTTRTNTLFKIILLLGLIFSVYFAITKNWFNSKDQLNSDHRVILEKVSTLGKLNLVKYRFKDIVEQEITRDFLPNPKALLIIEGEAVGCIDFQKIKNENIKFTDDTIVLRLPRPEICYIKIDHQKSKVYDTEFAFMNEEILLEEAYKKAEKQIEKSAINSGILEQTLMTAEQILSPLLSQIAQKPIVCEY